MYSSHPRPASARGLSPFWGLIALLCSGLAPAFGTGREEVRGPGLSGLFLVCKEYGTVRGTFLTNVAGRDVTRLNFLFGEGVDPRFSPVDDRVLFTSTRGGAPGLWTMDRKGQQQKRVCDGDQGDWFPDGRRIVFRREGRILERSLDTGRETVLSPAGWKSCSSPASSPDGRTVLFVTRDGPADAICLAMRGQSGPKRLVEGEILGPPRWSPAGERIAYQSGAHLWTIDADGSNRRQLTTAGGIQRRPAWSPDGTAIAFCQGPGPKGPWQMAVTGLDGTRKSSIPQDDARSVLCSDWGVEEAGRRPEPKGAAVRPPPRVRLWEFDRPVTAATADWAAFCRERKGWNAISAEKPLTDGCAVENGGAVLLLLAGRPGAVLLSKGAPPRAIEFTLLDPQGKEAGPIESVRVLSCGPDEAVLESSSHSAGARVKATWAIGGNQAMVRVTPLENAGKLRAAVPMQCVVVPDRFGNDIVADPLALAEEHVLLPWAPLVTGLLGSGSDMLVLICPEQGQTAQLRKGTGTCFAHADVAFQLCGVSAGVLRCQRVWHLERFGVEGPADPLRFNWRMPFAANWRLAVQGGRQRYSAFFSDKQSALFDKKDVLFRKSNGFTAAVRLGVIYLYGRTAGTPPGTPTPVDLLRDALGLKVARQVLDEDGLTGYRRAAGPTTWAEFSVTIESLRYLFERQLEVQDRVYARHLCDDLPAFVEGMDQRLKEYADFSWQLQALCGKSDKPSPAGKKLLDDLAVVVRKLEKHDERQRRLRSAKELLPLCTKIQQLTAKESGENRKQFEQCCRDLLRAVGPREEMLKAYRGLAVEARDAAGPGTIRRMVAQDGRAPLEHPELLGFAEKIRAICQGVLRNRFYTEGDWRGEDYDVPAFWLGPRPYE
jgi:hypothetical protein